MILVLSARHADQEKATLLDCRCRRLRDQAVQHAGAEGASASSLETSEFPRAATGTTIRHEGLSMNLETRTLLRDGELVHLTPTEWELVRVLMTNAGKTMTHRQLFAAVWPGRQYGMRNSTCACMSQT